ncbi:MAG TPA: histidine phosphatase family protein [Beutenbergiaceae bacterium]|nr:histidine phosphatase family protein [Beutenbergiaceae bacterium]
MRQLTLLRHAQADPHSPTGEDADRALSIRGREQAKNLAALLRAHGAVPQLVLCSTANRAVQTWKLTAAGLTEASPDHHPNNNGIEVRRLPDLYGAGPGDLLDVVRATPAEVTSVLVVGHEPVVSHVARVLAGPQSQEQALARIRTGMSTAMLAFLRTENPWPELGRGAATLTGLAEPEPGA